MADTLARNPAQRLLDLITQANEVGRQSPGLYIGDVWHQVLDTARDDSVLLRRLGIVQGIPLTVRQQVMSLPNERSDLLLKYMPRVVEGLKQPLVAEWGAFQNIVNETAIHSLEIISYRLDQVPLEPETSEAELNLLLEELVKLHAEVGEAKISEQLRGFLSHHLREMTMAIVDVGIVGPLRVQESAEAAFGAMIARTTVYGSPTQPEEKSFWDRATKVTTTTLAALTIITAPFNLAIAAQEAIGSGSDSGPPPIEIVIDDVDAP